MDMGAHSFPSFFLFPMHYSILRRHVMLKLYFERVNNFFSFYY